MTQQTRLLTQTVAPALEPVTLAEAKLYLRLDGTAEDSLVQTLILTARQAAEVYLRRSLITQTWKLTLQEMCTQVELPRGPVQAVTLVQAIAKDGSVATVSSATYRLNASKRVIEFDAVVSAHRLEITYIAGYGNAASDVPSPIRAGMLSHIAQLFDGRGDADIPHALYTPFCEVGI